MWEDCLWCSIFSRRWPFMLEEQVSGMVPWTSRWTPCLKLHDLDLRSYWVWLIQAHHLVKALHITLSLTSSYICNLILCNYGFRKSPVNLEPAVLSRSLSHYSSDCHILTWRSRSTSPDMAPLFDASTFFPYFTLSFIQYVSKSHFRSPFRISSYNLQHNLLFVIS